MTIPVPVIQGGMGVGISLSGLAVAVANAGGVGVISAAGLGMVHKDRSLNYAEANIAGLRYEIQQAKLHTTGAIGVNIMVAMTNFADLVRTAIEERVDIIFSGAGLPLDLPAFLKPDSKTRLVPIVSSGRAARLICSKWKSLMNYLPDAVVVEGPKAGGHLGFKESLMDHESHTLETLVPEVVAEVKVFEDESGKEIPVIAAGGIYSGEDAYEIMKLGAKGVQLGTRFVTTQECDASPEFKQAYLDAVQEDIGIIHSPVGMPGRAIVNDFLDKVSNGLKQPLKCPFHCIKTCDISSSPYCIIQALYNAYRGNMSKGFAFAGVNAYRTNAINTVKDVIEDLKQGFARAMKADNGER